MVHTNNLCRKFFKIILLIIGFCTICIASFAQHQVLIKGIVVDEQDKPVANATVFIAGSKKATSADSSGRFVLYPESRGTFQISVSMLGYEKFSQTVLVADSSVFTKIKLKSQNVALNEVVITSPGDRARNLKFFESLFIGQSKNAKKCKILNPETIVFAFDKDKAVLSATSDNFILIENNALGYLIKYSLKQFSFSYSKEVVLYDGDIIFEDLIGSQKQKELWKSARIKAYQNSLMHFFRAIYSDSLAANGFSINQAFKDIYKDSGWGFGRYVVEINPNKLNFNEQRSAGILNLKFVKILVSHRNKKLSTTIKGEYKNARKEIIVGDDDSIVYLLKPNLVIDGRGDYSDHSSLYIRGAFAMLRVADQLPYEYRP